ncbi:MAG: hypothetical protein AB1730_09680 [Myxococcota bacterium]|jgi:hypothetical protein
MDLLLLLVQVLLVVLLVVIPLFSGYDKWQAWSPQRRLIAVALAAGIAVVAFGQYRHIVNLSSGGLEAALSGKPVLRGPWYARRVAVSLWEWLCTVAAGSVLLALTVDAWRSRKKRRAAGYAAVFGLMLALGALLKLRTWSD